MATVLDIIKDAMKQIGALAVGENPSAEEADDALTVLNDMLDMWRTESLMVYNIDSTEFTVTSGKGVYTLGTGGDFNIPRPDKIVSAYMRDVRGNDYGMTVTTNSQEYSDLISKYVTSTLPTLVYDNGNYPLKELSFWPVPADSSYKFVLWTWGILAGFTAVTDTVSLPSGYTLAIKTNLAYLLCPRYGVTNVGQIEKDAIKTKAQIKRFNSDSPNMTFPSSLTGEGSTFNWLTGQPM